MIAVGPGSTKAQRVEAVMEVLPHTAWLIGNAAAGALVGFVSPASSGKMRPTAATNMPTSAPIR